MMIPDKTERRRALLLGSFVGDAFVLGAHWIYDVSEIEAHFGDYSAPQEPLPGTWHKGKHLGDYTHYGDQALLLNGYLKAAKGVYSDDGFRKHWQQHMSGYRGYMDMASKESLAAFAKGDMRGSHSDELGGAARMAPALYWVDDPALAVETVVSQSMLTHNSDESYLATALFAGVTVRALEHPDKGLPDMLRASLSDMNRTGQNASLLERYLEKAEAVAGRSPADIAAALGQSCHARHAIPVIMAILLSENDYRSALQLNARIGGDSATRGMIAGAILGAKNGMAGVPEDWLAMVKRLPDLE